MDGWSYENFPKWYSRCRQDLEIRGNSYIEKDMVKEIDIVEIFYSRKKSFVENVQTINNSVVRSLLCCSQELENG